jgi:hypothetical protein
VEEQQEERKIAILVVLGPKWITSRGRIYQLVEVLHDSSRQCSDVCHLENAIRSQLPVKFLQAI